MTKIVLATHNKGKLTELSGLLDLPQIELCLLGDINCHEDIPETGNTMEQNAIQKATFVHQNYGCNCISDDSGLEVNALNGAPGVYSARYAGNHKNSEDNITKLLNELGGKSDRTAQFRTVLCLLLDGRIELFEGVIKGSITTERKGSSGFGYDSVFMPNGYTKTFAEMDLVKKNKISHRALAVKKLVNYLTNI
ncbi:MAG: non-canonical purine NTP diphosphatase [Bacteroidetes bacterium]|nr:non-canonical purine NTP diphosphatase [Bacteroidota bacterium]